jgi:hypothetical protein
MGVGSGFWILHLTFFSRIGRTSVSKLASERNSRSFQYSRPGLAADMVALPGAEDTNATVERGFDESPLRETQQRIHTRVLV